MKYFGKEEGIFKKNYKKEVKRERPKERGQEKEKNKRKEELMFISINHYF